MFTDGITNKLIGCFNTNFPEDVILVRVYGQNTDLLIDRKAETENIKVQNAAAILTARKSCIYFRSRFMSDNEISLK